ncbi:homeodomain-like containing protein [Theileria orientalis strain Shintoku]|uniref:Homeodomain-like containing protein n=1 Tax=Theileria orientalis strain Shintoku TaxID=869250 RepID=J4C319_THEOR|nr:homeodomain-like containing protein [Theileria orientalis strain Shintoku]PVC52443.1 homeodomain-like containing protein [Theileria orientalis]BAM39671.1 homeodomain-like containing protein [Theileria orientalis strain Shintoku]|eukprot:XP_009689972.1 homeodomain-like containing protein [Theileria orientalis strain Shintoku]
MDKKFSKDKEKEIPSIPTSYRILIKGPTSSADSKQLKVSVDDKRHIWRMCSFRNPARSDGLVLKHWRHFEKGSEYLSLVKRQRKYARNKISKNVDDDSTCTLARVEEEESVLDSYSFARVNPSVKIYRYSDDFYLFHLADLDPTWTKDETDLLFDLCEMFELRFIAIHDSFKWRKDVSLEKLKQRYYTVTKRIVEFLFEEKIKNEIMKHGNPNHPVVLSLKEESARHPLVKFTYNCEHDRERRQMLERSYRITPEQREAETQLLNEIKNAEALLKSEEKKRTDLKKLKRKFNMNDSEVIPTPKLDQFQSSPVYLASSFLNFYKSQLTQHHNDSVDEMLSELNISPPAVSSQASNELYCIVRGDAAIMINIVNKVESLRSELEHWQQLTNHSVEPSISSYGQSKVKDETFSETSEHAPVYQMPHSIMAKSFPKAKQPMAQLQQMTNVPPVTTVTNLSNIQNVQALHDDGNQEAMLQAARQRMMMQSLAQQGQQMKQMYQMKAPAGGGASPHAYQPHMYPQFAQQMYHPQVTPRVLQQHMAQRLIQQQQFQQQQQQQQKQHFQHMMPMHPEGAYSPSQRYSQPGPYPPVMHPHQLQKGPPGNNQKQ